MILEDGARPFRKCRTTNSTDASFPSRIATLTEPAQDGVVDLALSSGLYVPRKVLVLPYGLGSDEDAFSLRILGWHRITLGQGSQGTLWVPFILGEFSCTLGTASGVAGSPVLNTELFVDTITVVSEGTYTADVTRLGSVKINSPANNTAAHLLIELDGAEKVEFIFDQTTNTPAMNCLISAL